MIGGPAGFLAGAFVALDLHHIAVSKVVHIDLMLTLLITACAVCYLQWLATSKLAWKLLAGVAWGLAVSTKPTAILILPGLGLANAVAYFLYRKRRSHPLIDWSDVWTGILGLGVFASIYTRMWYPVGRQGYKLNVWHGRKIWVDRLGDFTSAHALLCMIGIAGLGALSLYALRRASAQSASGSQARRPQPVSAGLARHVFHIGALSTLFAAIALLVPQVLKNMLGYWIWALGLQGEKHVAYGRVWQAPPYGYTGFLLSKPSSLVLIGAVLGLACIPLLANRLARTARADERAEKQLLAVSLAGFVCLFWLLGLSTSSKQAWRYAMPIVPMLSVLAAYGLFHAGLFLVALVTKARQSVRFAAQTALVAMLIIIDAGSALAWAANPELFFNLVSGGLPAAIERKSPLPFAAQNEVVDFLHDFALKQPRRPLQVTVIGDPQTLRYAYDRRHPVDGEPDGRKTNLVSIRNWTGHARGQYVVVFESMLDRLEGNWKSLEIAQPVFRHELQGVRLASVYPVLPPTVEDPLVIRAASNISHRVGKLEAVNSADPKADVASLPDGTAVRNRMLIARPKRDRAGYLLSNSYVNVAAGKYRAVYQVSIPVTAPELALDADSRPVARVTLSKKCTREISLSELQNSAGRGVSQISFECAFTEPAYVQLQVYWFGKVPFALHTVTVAPSTSEVFAAVSASEASASEGPVSEVPVSESAEALDAAVADGAPADEQLPGSNTIGRRDDGADADDSGE